MSRINIEQSILTDQRFFKLGILLGELECALGAVVLAWDLSQKFFLKSNAVIPNEEWLKLKYGAEVIAVGLADNVDGGVYVKGSREQFDWLRQRQHGGQKRSSSSQRDSSGRWIKHPAAAIADQPSSLLPPPSILKPPPSSKNEGVIENFEIQFDERWNKYEESLSSIMQPVHLRKIRVFKSKLFRHFGTLDELKQFCNPFLENLRGFTKNQMSDAQISSALFNKLLKTFEQLESMELTQ